MAAGELLERAQQGARHAIEGWGSITALQSGQERGADHNEGGRSRGCKRLRQGRQHMGQIPDRILELAKPYAPDATMRHDR
jgi:hypothetical protein